MIQIVIKVLVVAATIMINIKLGSSVSPSSVDWTEGEGRVVPGLVDREYILIDFEAITGGKITGAVVEESTEIVLLVETGIE